MKAEMRGRREEAAGSRPERKGEKTSEPPGPGGTPPPPTRTTKEGGDKGRAGSARGRRKRAGKEGGRRSARPRQRRRAVPIWPLNHSCPAEAGCTPRSPPRKGEGGGTALFLRGTKKGAACRSEERIRGRAALGCPRERGAQGALSPLPHGQALQHHAPLATPPQPPPRGTAGKEATAEPSHDAKQRGKDEPPAPAARKQRGRGRQKGGRENGGGR